MFLKVSVASEEMHRLCIRDPYSTRSKDDEANRKEKDYCRSYRINFMWKLRQTSFVFRGL